MFLNKKANVLENFFAQGLLNQKLWLYTMQKTIYSYISQKTNKKTAGNFDI